MPKLRIPVLLKDRDAERMKEFLPTELRTVVVESLLPGPVSDRVAIVDLQPGGALAEPLPVPTLPTPERPEGWPDHGGDPYRDPFTIRWSAFATVLETLKLYESADCLGRKVDWAFAGEQLLVVPDAGAAANAFYHRESRSLQLFSFDGPTGHAHTAASHDIVAHETGHAILDGIAPWLYDASSPQSLAIHESIADLTALFAALSSRTLLSKAIELTGGDLTQTWIFSAIARELRDLSGNQLALRSLTDPEGGPILRLDHFGDGRLPAEPHHLSEVLSRAFYAVLLDAYEARLPAEQERHRKSSRAGDLHFDKVREGAEPGGETSTPSTPPGQAFRALLFAGGLVKRLLIRGLDYLPPGDVGFVELARAVLACDLAAHPEDSTGLRRLLTDRLVERGIGTEATLSTDHAGIADPMPQEDLDAVVASTWHAMRFVEARRKRLGIPDGTPFDVLPRLVTAKELYRSTGKAVRREVVLKVSWKEQEDADAPPPLPKRRWVRRGVTVVFDRDDGSVCAFIDHAGRGGADERDFFAKALGDGHSLAARPTGTPDRSPYGPVGWRVHEGAYELVGAARALHLTTGRFS